MERARVRGSGGANGIHVVMVVANDVTRDSRVLREAGALAAAGHRVTVLGIMTARTTAPEAELRDGFVIRRLRYRARPPGWWVPPDFYSRLRYRADRQYRIHRARLRSTTRRLQWQRRVIAMVDRVRLRRGREQGPRNRVMRRRGSVERPQPPLHVRISYRVSDSWSSSRAIWRRARNTPLACWPAKVQRRLLMSVPMSAIALVRSRFGPRRRARSATNPPATALLRPVRVVLSGLRTWAAIVSLLLWGSTYLVANRLTRGAVEWATGWRWRWLGWARYVAECAPDADVWHGHDMTSLPAVVELKRRRGGYAVYDSHEIYLESGRHADQPRWAKRGLERLERRLAGEVDAIITVNRSLAPILAQRLDHDDVRVLYNCPVALDEPPRASRLRASVNLGDHVPVLLYHGSLAPHRGIEELLTAIRRPELAGAHLVFLGFGSLTEWLSEETRHRRYEGRVHLVDAVSPDELPDWLAGADVSVAPIQPSTLNHRLSSPNKVFEAIAAGVPVAGSDFPEFRQVIADPELGPLGTLFHPSDPADIARAVLEILDLPPSERQALRERCLAASRGRWNWGIESRTLVATYEELASGRTGQRPVAEVGAA